MKNLTVASIALWTTLAGCATTETVGAAGAHHAPPRAEAPALAASATLQTAADALLCMLEQASDAARCAALADAAAVPVAALTRAEVAATEPLSEILMRRARAERMPMARRALVLRWFDLAAAAAREAARARAGAEGQSVREAAGRGAGQADAEVLEDAAAQDAAQVRARAQLAALFALVPEADELAPEVEATALLVLAHRLETAARARPEVRDDAAAAVADALREAHLAALTAEPAPATTGGNASTHGRAGADPVASAPAQLSERLASVAPRVRIGVIRVAAERTAARAPAARR